MLRSLPPVVLDDIWITYTTIFYNTSRQTSSHATIHNMFITIERPSSFDGDTTSAVRGFDTAVANNFREMPATATATATSPVNPLQEYISQLNALPLLQNAQWADV